MTLLEQINKDMIEALKNKDSFTLGVIRMAKGAIQLEGINKKKDLTDEDVVAVISKQIKMRNDSIAEFTKANRMDLVEQNKKEIEEYNKKSALLNPKTRAEYIKRARELEKREEMRKQYYKKTRLLG